MGNELSQPVIIKRNKILRESEADLCSKKGWPDDGGVYIGEPDHTLPGKNSEDTSPKTLFFRNNQMNEDEMSGEPIIQKVKLCDLAKMYTGRKTEATSPVQPVYCDNINGDDASRVDMCNNHVEKVHKLETMDEIGEKLSSVCSEKDEISESEEFRTTQAVDVMKRLSGGENGITKEMFEDFTKESQPTRPPRPSKLAKMRLNVSDFELKGKKYSKPRKGDPEKATVNQTKLDTEENQEEKLCVQEMKPQEGEVSKKDELRDSEFQSDTSDAIQVETEQQCIEKISLNLVDEMGNSRAEEISSNSQDKIENSHIETSIHDSHDELENSQIEIEEQCSSAMKETNSSCIEEETINLCVNAILESSNDSANIESLDVRVEAENPFTGGDKDDETPHLEKKIKRSVSEKEGSISNQDGLSSSLDSAVKENGIPVCEVKPLRVIAKEVVHSNKIPLDNNVDAIRFCEDSVNTGNIQVQEDISEDLAESRNCEANLENTTPKLTDVNVSEENGCIKKEKKLKYNTFSRKVAAIWAEYPHGDTVAKEPESTKESKKEPKVKKSNSFWKYLTYHETPKKTKERQKRKKSENGILNSSALKNGQNEVQVQTATRLGQDKEIVNGTPVTEVEAEEALVMVNEVYVDTSVAQSISTSNNTKSSFEVSCKENGHVSETLPQRSDMLRERPEDKSVKEIELSDTIVECKINGTESGLFEGRTNLKTMENMLPSHTESTLGSGVVASSEIQRNMEPISAKEKRGTKTTKRNNSISAKISDFFLQDFRRRSSNKGDKRPDKAKPERRRKHSSTGSKNSSSSIEESTIQEVPEEVTESDRTSKAERLSGISKFLSLSSMNLSTIKDKKPKRRKSSSTMDIAGIGVNDVRPSDTPRQRPKSIFDEDIEVTIDDQKDDVVSLSSLSSDNEDEGKHKVQVHVPTPLPQRVPVVVAKAPEQPSVEGQFTEVEVPLTSSASPKLNSHPESENKQHSDENDLHLKEDSYVRLRVESNDTREDILTCSGSDSVLRNSEPVTDLDADCDLPADLPVTDKNECDSVPNDNEEIEQTVDQQVYVSSCTLSLSSPLYNLISEGGEESEKTGEEEQEVTERDSVRGAQEATKELIDNKHGALCDATSYDYEVVSPPSTEKSINSDRNLERFGLMLAERGDQTSSETQENISPSSDTDIVRTLSLQELHVQMHVYDEIENKRPIIYRRFSDRDERDVIRTAPDGTDGKRGKKKKRSRSFSDLFKKSGRRKAQWKAKRKSRDDTTRRTADDTTRKTTDDISPTTGSPTSSIVHM